MVERDVREDGLRHGVVELHPEVDVEPVVGPQVGHRQAGPLLVGELDVVPRLDQAVVGLDPVVVAGLEVVDEVAAGPERAAADVDEPVVRLQALRAEVLQLALAVGVPDAADELRGGPPPRSPRA